MEEHETWLEFRVPATPPDLGRGHHTRTTPRESRDKTTRRHLQFLTPWNTSADRRDCQYVTWRCSGAGISLAMQYLSPVALGTLHEINSFQRSTQMD